jgi:hypothetical protein
VARHLLRHEEKQQTVVLVHPTKLPTQLIQEMSIFPGTTAGNIIRGLPVWNVW